MKKYKKLEKIFSRIMLYSRFSENYGQDWLETKKFGISIIDYNEMVDLNLKNLKKYFAVKMWYSAVFWKLYSGLTWNQKIRYKHYRLPNSGWRNNEKLEKIFSRIMLYSRLSINFNQELPETKKFRISFIDNYELVD